MKIREGVIYEDLDFLMHAVLLAKKVGNVKEILYIYKDNQQSATKKHREQKKFENMLSALEAIQGLECIKELETQNVIAGMQYAKLTCIACAVAICLLNQDNPEFLLINNLKTVRRISEKVMENWQNNQFVISKMEQENKDILAWLADLKI